jgi:hypothetical protein
MRGVTMGWYPEMFKPIQWYILDEQHRTRGVYRYTLTEDEPLAREINGAVLVRTNSYNSAVEVVHRWSWTPGAEPTVTPERAAELLEEDSLKEQ